MTNPNPYGTLCPHCGAPTVSRTRGIPARDTCAKNHRYLASEGVRATSQAEVATKAAADFMFEHSRLLGDCGMKATVEIALRDAFARIASGVSASGEMADRIAYLIVTQPGGVDGLDASDKGGVIVDASFDKAAMEKRKGVDSRYRIDTKVVGDSDRRAALAKLSKLDRLLLDIK